MCVCVCVSNSVAQAVTQSEQKRVGETLFYNCYLFGLDTYYNINKNETRFTKYSITIIHLALGDDGTGKCEIANKWSDEIMMMPNRVE